MMNAFLLMPTRPLSIGADAITGPATFDPNFPVSALLDKRPKVVWKAAAGAAASQIEIVADMGSDVPVDTVSLLFLNGVDNNVTYTVRGAATNEGTYGHGLPLKGLAGFGDTEFRTMWVPGTPPVDYAHSLAIGSAVKAVRYVQLLINLPANYAISGGVLAIGQRLQPLANIDIGAGRKIDDLSTVTDLPDGGIAVWRGAKVSSWRATWGNLEDGELDTLWTILRLVGFSDPVLAVENPDPNDLDLHARLHYGQLRGVDYFQRTQTDKSEIELIVRGWL